MTIPELVKRGWSFPHLWDDKLGFYYVWAKKLSWGLASNPFFHSGWEPVHEKARSWAVEQESIINEHDTIPCPMVDDHASQ